MDSVSATSFAAFSSAWSTTMMIDQSGLSAGYSSGVTDLGTYAGSGVTHDGLSAGSDNGFASSVIPFQPGYFIFDMGEVLDLSEFLLWGDDSGPSNSAPKNFSLSASTDASFSSSVALGTFQATTSGDALIPLQTFSFATTSARYVRWDVLSVYGSFQNLNVGEVAFAGPSGATGVVPLPAGAVLLASGLMALSTLQSRRRAQRRR